MSQYWTDFSEYTTGNTPSDWTLRWGDYDISVGEDVAAVGGKLLHISPNANSGNEDTLLSWDAVDSDAYRDDFEILMKLRFLVSLTNNKAIGIGRANGAYATRDVYGGTFQPGNGYVTLEKWVNGSYSTILNDTGNNFSLNTWYWMRVRINGNIIQAKYWEDGTEEPVGWIVSSTDSDLTAVGWIGWGTYFDSANQEIDIFSVGTAGDTAPSTDPGGGGTTISGTAALTDSPETAALAGSLALAGQAAGVDNPGTLASIGAVSIAATTAIVDNPEVVSADLALMLAGSGDLTDNPEPTSLGGALSLAASGAINDNPVSAQLQAVLLLSGSAALADSPEQLSITGSFGDIIRGSAALVDGAESASAAGKLILGGSAAIEDAPTNLSIDGNLLLAAQAAIEDSEQSFQALCDIILSMSIAITDNPETLQARQLVISEQVKITVTGQRVGNTISISGEKVAGRQLVSGPKAESKRTVN